MRKFAEKLKLLILNKICKNYKVYFLFRHWFLFFAYNWHRLAYTGLTFGRTGMSKALFKIRAKFDFVDFKLRV